MCKSDRLASVMPALLLACSLTACGGGQQPGSQPSPAQNQQINGAGATFPTPIYSKWFAK